MSWIRAYSGSIQDSWEAPTFCKCVREPVSECCRNIRTRRGQAVTIHSVFGGQVTLENAASLSWPYRLWGGSFEQMCRMLSPTVYCFMPPALEKVALRLEWRWKLLCRGKPSGKRTVAILLSGNADDHWMAAISHICSSYRFTGIMQTSGDRTLVLVK